MTEHEPGARRFFVSHSSAQKPFALDLYEVLRGEAWIDLHEIDVGDVLLEEISEGIEAASDFVLLWSREAANSAWVRYELHMAFIRFLEDNSINLRVVLLDDTPVPLYLRPLLQARSVLKPDDAAAVLLGAPPGSRTLRPFVNRSDEIAALESLLYSADQGFIWFFGLAGVGKRSVAHEGLRRLVADRDRARAVTIRAGTGFVELHLKLCEALELQPPQAELTEREARQDAVTLLTDFSSDGGVWLFEDVQHWLDDEALPKPQLAILLEALRAIGVEAPVRGALFTSTRRPALPEQLAAASVYRRVRGLSSNFAVALLRNAGAEGEEGALRKAAQQLDGHPLALEMSIKDVQDPSIDWSDRQAATARAILGGLQLAEATEGLLEALAALDGPLPAQQLAQHLALDSEQFQTAVAEASSYSLVEERASYLYAHPLVREFYLRAFRRRVDYRDRLSDLADRSREFLKKERRSRPRVDSLLTTFRLLSSSGRLGEALALHRRLFGTMLESGIELFHERRYDEALPYFEAVIESTEENQEARTYAARSLAYLGRDVEARAIADNLLEEFPDDASMLRIRARIESILRKWDSAFAFLERARGLRPDALPTLRDIGQVQIRRGEWAEARVALERAIQTRREPGAWLNYYYSQVLEHDGDFDEARTVIESALRLDPDVPIFRHRLGRIALRQGDEVVAEREFRRALTLDPKLHEAAISLASLLVSQGATEEARRLARAVAKMPGVRPALLATIEAKVAFAEMDLDGARRAAEQALAEEREAESLLLLGRVQLATYRGEPSKAAYVRASVLDIADELCALGEAGDADVLQEELRQAKL